MDEKQVFIKFQCDKGKVAQCLRMLADTYDYAEREGHGMKQYETPICFAEITEEE